MNGGPGHLDESISSFRGFHEMFAIYYFCQENSVDPDQMPYSVASDQGQHCLDISPKWVFRVTQVQKSPYSKGVYRKNSKIWDTSNNCHNCLENRKI